jgi:methylenetetrahydrofolate reductase (NADPH)
MKISQKIQQTKKEGKVWWSFEYFPPRTDQVYSRSLAERLPVSHLIFQGLQNLLDRIERMRELGPEFIDITWCALPLSSSCFEP